MRRVDGSAALAHLVASTVLSYPDEELRAKLPALARAAATLPRPTGEPLRRVIGYLDGVEPAEAAAHYVDTFDLRRRCCLYLTYYTHGDTRRRGEALLRFAHAYRAAGLELAEAELPDHLAVVLEFSAAGHAREATELLVEHRAGLELLWRALDQIGSPYADAVAAVRVTLPAAGSADLAAARRLAEQGPPAEQVGLAPPAVPGSAPPTVPGVARRPVPVTIVAPSSARKR